MTPPTTPRDDAPASLGPRGVDPFWIAARGSTNGHALLAELGRAPGAVAILARAPDGALVALRIELAAAVGAGTYRVTEHRELDLRIPAPASRCQVCSATIAAWRGACPVCGHRPSAPATRAPADAELISALQSHTGSDHRLVGSIPCSGGELAIYFAERLGDLSLAALRLSMRDESWGPGAAYDLEVLALPGEPAAAELTSGVAAPPETREPDVELVCLECGARYGGNVKFCPKDGSGLQRPVQVDGLVGQTIDDRYYVESRIGQGGMGEVYLAKQIRTGRRCALKLMHRSLMGDGEAIGRFRREAASACAVSHPNIATVYDYGETGDGVPYFAMEYVEGRSLASVLAAEGALPPLRALDIARQIAEALTAAHELTIVHRDLKPDNVMLAVARGGVDLVKVVDFGIAKATHGDAGKITRTGLVIGTIFYMSPEQIRGDPLDGRTDLYSLGCVLFEMLAGQPLYPGLTSELVMVRRLTEEAPRLRTVAPAIPSSIDDLVAVMLASGPESRVQSAHELSERLLAELARLEATGAGSVPALSRPRPASSITIDRIDTTSGVGAASPQSTPLSPAVSMPSRRMAAPPVADAEPAAAREVTRPLDESGGRRSKALLFGGLALAIGVAVVAIVATMGGDPPATAGAAVESSPLGGAPLEPPARPREVTSSTPAAGDSVQRGPGRALEPVTPSDARAGAQPPSTRGGTDSAAVRARLADSIAAAATAAGINLPASAGGPPVVTTPPVAIETSRVAVPTPPPAARPTIPVVDSAEVLARVERPLIQEVVDRFVAAIAARDLNAMLAIYPAMPQQEQNGWRLLFRDASGFTAQMTGAPAVTVAGDEAQAQFGYAMRGRNPNAAPFDIRRTVRASLRRGPGGWSIRQITSAP